MSLDVWNKAFSHSFYIPVRKTQQGCMYFSWSSIISSIFCKYLSVGCLVFYWRCFWKMLWWNLSFLKEIFQNLEIVEEHFLVSPSFSKRYLNSLSHTVYLFKVQECHHPRAQLPSSFSLLEPMYPTRVLSNKLAVFTANIKIIVTT